MWTDGSLDEFKRFSTVQFSQIRLLRGHFGFGIHQYLPTNPRYFTILRDPIARTISYYHFVRRTPHHYCHELVTANNMSLQSFIESRQDMMVDNGQTRLLCGIETGHEIPFGNCSQADLDSAMYNLGEHFAVVGLTERFDETLLLLKRQLGWGTLFYADQNVTTAPSSGSAEHPTSQIDTKYKISEATYRAIEQVNLLDIQLYEYAKSLFDDQVGQQEPEFAEAVHQFQQRNRWFAPFLGLFWQLRSISVRTMVRERLKILG